jgi:probable F420-dependent oxidoreductase
MLAFGVSAFRTRAPGELTEAARQAEAWGFDNLWVADHVGFVDPFAALVAAAAATERLRVGTYVLNVEFWNPLLLARVAATTDLLTDGRLTLGLGAGHAAVEFEQAGLPYPSPGPRVDRLVATLHVLRALLRGETVDEQSLGLKGAATGLECVQAPVPILVGGNGRRVLELAGAAADVAGVVGFTSGTGQVHSDLSHWTWAGLHDRVAVVRAAATAAGRAEPPTFDLLVQRVALGDDRGALVREFLDDPDADVDLHLDSPFLLLGTEDEIAAQLQRLDEELGGANIGVTVFGRDAEALAPVIARLRR